ncbi:PREDICTED: translation initiation factor IF-2-like [Ceratotherium simum simum]|uniref:Translation initiation factor IF-2-like n=1 Tax=Ceratotherium simum simum TaxID=73337 RepID=A0ABM1CQL8_CERSS|nr:PREDICTED: translation initiation factor IF-2-like [Ceratotherium simum simum]
MESPPGSPCPQSRRDQRGAAAGGSGGRAADFKGPAPPSPPPVRASSTVRGGGSWGAAPAAADARPAGREAGAREPETPRDGEPEPGPEEAPAEASSRRAGPGAGAAAAARFGKEDEEEAALPAGEEEALRPGPRRRSFNHIRASAGNALRRLSPVPSILKGKKGSPPSPPLRSWSRRSRAHGVQPVADPVPRAVGEMDVVRGARRGRRRGRGRRAGGRPRRGGLASRDQIVELQLGF